MPILHDLRHSSSAQRLAILIALVAISCFTGGSSQWDRFHLLVLRPALVLGLTALLLIRGEMDWRLIRWPLVMLGIFAATMVVQLIPLPPSWWKALPGRDRYMESFAADPGAWHPISLVPDLTVNALLGLLPALAVLLAYAGMSARHRRATAWLVVAAAGLSILFGFIQVAGGASSWAFLYGFGDRGVPTGIFANRNHHASLLALSIPVAAALLNTHHRTYRHWAAAVGLAVLAPPAVLLSGSRAGLALCVVGLLVAATLLPTFGQPGRSRTLIRWGVVAVVLAGLAALSVLMFERDRALSFARLIDDRAITEDRRAEALPTVLRMRADFSPFGVGHGAFEPIFRSYEPPELLHSRYFNRAHNDPLELLVTGGLPALLPMLLLVIFLIRQAIDVWRSGRDQHLRKAGLAAVAMLAAASFVDYPLRTALGTIIFSLALCWLASGGSALVEKRERQRSGTSAKVQAI